MVEDVVSPENCDSRDTLGPKRERSSEYSTARASVVKTSVAQLDLSDVPVQQQSIDLE